MYICMYACITITKCAFKCAKAIEVINYVKQFERRNVKRLCTRSRLH